MIVLNGKIDAVIEMRKKNWIVRAWGISFGQWFFGVLIFTRVAPVGPVRCDGGGKA